MISKEQLARINELSKSRKKPVYQTLKKNRTKAVERRVFKSFSFFYEKYT
ncbi:hypothetical protein BsIDN1_33350 [Bacillus safensis]|uniref:Uncharacterized protein n=1 Tax=Bacillus safensis TaxID=561879 RepID=A0A5S9M891_BACIA|nr:hypothetical protein BsIDN1_33350 [Bacillus safensis]